VPFVQARDLNPVPRGISGAGGAEMEAFTNEFHATADELEQRMRESKLTDDEKTLYQEIEPEVLRERGLELKAYRGELQNASPIAPSLRIWFAISSTRNSPRRWMHGSTNYWQSLRQSSSFSCNRNRWSC
jgi:hypothetical protein